MTATSAGADLLSAYPSAGERFPHFREAYDHDSDVRRAQLAQASESRQQPHPATD